MAGPFKLDTFDRLGIAVVGLLGVTIGLMIASTSDLTPTAALQIIVPGLRLSIPVTSTLGLHAGVVAGGISNGIAYAALLYGWFRLVATIRNGLPHRFADVGHRLSTLRRIGRS